MSKLLVRTEKELHEKVFKKAFPNRIWKINDSGGVSDVVIQVRDKGHAEFVEYKALRHRPKDSLTMNHKRMGIRPAQARFLQVFQGTLAVLVVPERRVYLFDHEVGLSLAEDKYNFQQLVYYHGFGSVLVDSPQELREFF